ncbi:uncharacterized protein EAF02_004680 [Botrytis sinoallii]|uniref:uncharacterized protein n=1 Tax=Botrytis sinoallii TaxID=1463999 RepID=UPI001901F898|nr:uncharacterized protein EAF02_004680 [Botrytis sinoallii]KAF7884344.1 hypothetical protein EAF02_004680 [Botrytis sinoallii]
MGGFTIDRSKTIHVPFRGPAAPTNVADQSRECERANEFTGKKIRTVRRSRFREEGLDDEVIERVDVGSLGGEFAAVGADLRIRSTWNGISTNIPTSPVSGEKRGRKEPHDESRAAKIGKSGRRTIATSNTPPTPFSTMPRVALLAFLIAVVVPAFGYTGRQNSNTNVMKGNGADAGIIRDSEFVDNGSMIEGRADSPTSICTRWSHMTANVNGTLYIYGGEATTKSGQTTDTWNNDFVTLDLTKSWQISSPILSGLPQPSGPPAVAMGSLWHTYDSLFLYGGEFSDSPQTSPASVATWKYDISSATWTEFSNPQTSAGNGSDTAPADVQRAAEGAGLSVPELGRSWYFGGHLDMYTTPGWSNQIARIYLKSLLEFTHPGYTNTGVTSLGTTSGAGSGGVYRNITQGGLQDEAGFTERADGVLVYVPGWGADGMLLGLAGGTNETFTEMNIIDVYDIANSTWYKQATSGTTPPIRVDPCAVVAAAPDGSSFNVYLYGGQNLIPYGNQTQYSDMWILTIPSFTWIQVDMTDQSQSLPPARAGHTCNLWDGQMVVVGGYVGQDISCDSPGVYVFNASSLQWTNSFTALSSSSSSSSDQDSDIIKGSIGYTVPDIVQSVIGGSGLGGATATIPAAGSATAGPLATGKPPTFTVTQSPSTITSTSTSTPTSSPNSDKKGPNKAAIIAGVIAAALAFLAGYLAFCTWLYRRQLNLYKDHVAMSQRTAFVPAGKMFRGSGGSSREDRGMMLGPFGTDISGAGGVQTPSVRSEGGGLSSSGNEGSGSGSGSGNEDRGGASGRGSGTYVFGGGIMPGGASYQTIDEEDEGVVMGGSESVRAGWRGHRKGMGSIGSTGSITSSLEDLLGDREPSFFNVVMNPRRTLRVVNSD